MKRIISIAILAFIILGICIAVFSCGSDEEKQSESIYKIGSIESGKNISDYFTLIGSREVAGVAGANGITVVSCQQTADGGWVAWTDYKYIYTTENIGVNQIRNAAISNIVNVEGMNLNS